MENIVHGLGQWRLDTDSGGHVVCFELACPCQGVQLVCPTEADGFALGDLQDIIRRHAAKFGVVIRTDVVEAEIVDGETGLMERYGAAVDEREENQGSTENPFGRVPFGLLGGADAHCAPFEVWTRETHGPAGRKD